MIGSMKPRIDTTEVKKKLKAGVVMPGHIDEFCRVLSLRLDNETTPLGFLLSFELLISDMENATGRTIKWNGSCSGIETFIAGLRLGGVIRIALPKIIRTAFSSEHADEIMAELRSIQNG